MGGYIACEKDVIQVTKMNQRWVNIFEKLIVTYVPVYIISVNIETAKII
jgi:hypothetical protein